MTWAPGHHHKMAAKCDIKMKVIWVKTRSQHPCQEETRQEAAGLWRNAAEVTAVPLEPFVA